MPWRSSPLANAHSATQVTITGFSSKLLLLPAKEDEKKADVIQPPKLQQIGLGLKEDNIAPCQGSSMGPNSPEAAPLWTPKEIKLVLNKPTGYPTQSSCRKAQAHCP